MSQAYGINGITDFNFNTSWPEIQLADKQDDPEIFIPPADNIEDRFPDTDDSRFMVRRNTGFTKLGTVGLAAILGLGALGFKTVKEKFDGMPPCVAEGLSDCVPELSQEPNETPAAVRRN